MRRFASRLPPHRPHSYWFAPSSRSYCENALDALDRELQLVKVAGAARDVPARQTRRLVLELAAEHVGERLLARAVRVHGGLEVAQEQLVELGRVLLHARLQLKELHEW